MWQHVLLVKCGTGWRLVQFHFNNYSPPITSTNAMCKLPEDSAQALKHVGAFVI